MAQKFKRKGLVTGSRPSDVADRHSHADALLATLDQVRPPAGAPGVYLELTGRPGEPVDATKFNSSGLRLLTASQPKEIGGAASLVFFAPPKGFETLRKKVTAFRDQNTDTGRPKNADLAQSVGSFAKARLQSLWRGRAETFPQDAGALDWEVWIRNGHVGEFVAAAAEAGLHVAADRLDFPEDTVLQITASQEQLSTLVLASAHVSAVAKPATTAEFFDSLPIEEHAGWSEELLERTTFAEDVSAWVTLLDTGVALGHPLLTEMLDADDRHAADPAWALDDSDGHGTGMAGLASYGDLSVALQTMADIEIPHALESVKIIPDAGVNPHHLLGAVTRKGVNAVEAARARRRIFSLATSTYDDFPHDGAPTSWSTELDQLAAGRSGVVKTPRLFTVAAGNIKSTQHMTGAYHAICDHADQELESPAQAWNVVTVGAMTDKVTLGPGMAGAPLAPAGDLSPFSKTASWGSVWPLKPDIVMEGGNLVLDGMPPALSCTDLSLLTTHRAPAERHFTTFEATSAATALAARMAALIWAEHPARWPETIRALLVGSARWTQPMLAHLPAAANKGDYETLFRRYGYGAPDLQRALRSASQSVTLIVEDHITPYTHSATKGAGAVHNEIKLHTLPWPREALRALHNHPVTLRIALSTFVEPNPAEAARGRKLQYGSHGLRFRLNRPNESAAAFAARINAAAEQADDEFPGAMPGEQDGWRFGSRRRDVGSLHIDELTCPASDLARRNILAVHPVAGWWKSSLRQDQDPRRARYAMVVEIDAGDVEVDLYTEVQTLIANQVLIQAAVAI